MLLPLTGTFGRNQVNKKSLCWLSSLTVRGTPRRKMEKMVIRACPGISSSNSQALAEDIRAVCQHHHKAGGDATPTGKSGTSEFN